MAKFGMRNDYIVVSVYGPVNAFHANGQFGSYGSFGARVTGYAARCNCVLGDHYLARNPTTGAIVERLNERGAVPDACTFPTYDDAQAAIEAWQRQQRESEASE